jgi:hypothetical protein
LDSGVKYRSNLMGGMSHSPQAQVFDASGLKSFIG